MTPTRKSKNDYTSLEVDVGVLLNQQEGQNARLERIEKKIDNMNNVSTSDFVAYKQEAKETYVTKEDFAPIKTLFWGITLAIFTGIIGFGFYLLQRGFK